MPRAGYSRLYLAGGGFGGGRRSRLQVGFQIEVPRYYGLEVMTLTAKTARQAPLKVDPETDKLISQGAHFLGLTKKDLVAEAVRVYLEQRREDLRVGMVEALQVLDGSLKSDVMLLTGLTAEEIDAVGGIDE
ncbi:hypothetical protein GCM10023080_018920 [Streptomyces pseudoechinosporeus]